MSLLHHVCLVLCVLVPSLSDAATLGNPSNGGSYSGIGVISGWKCQAEGDLTIVFNSDGNHIPLLYGSQRPDVLAAGACAHDRAGFVTIWNWGELGEGTHTAVAYDDGQAFARSTFTVATLGEAFVEGLMLKLTPRVTVSHWAGEIAGDGGKMARSPGDAAPDRAVLSH